MSLLGSLGNLTKVVTDPGAIVQDALNKVLPKEIAGVVGNAAAGLVDYYSGNEVMAAKHALEALKDLPQMATALSKQSCRRHGRIRTLPQASHGPVGRFLRNCCTPGRSPIAPKTAQRPRNQHHHQRERHGWTEHRPPRPRNRNVRQHLASRQHTPPPGSIGQ